MKGRTVIKGSRAAQEGNLIIWYLPDHMVVTLKYEMQLGRLVWRSKEFPQMPGFRYLGRAQNWVLAAIKKHEAEVESIDTK